VYPNFAEQGGFLGFWSRKKKHVPLRALARTSGSRFFRRTEGRDSVCVRLAATNEFDGHHLATFGDVVYISLSEIFFLPRARRSTGRAGTGVWKPSTGGPWRPEALVSPR